ncbi:helix-turn-helix domain-containing protein [Yersinia ruckeri]|uniref:helix-turn-helix domain-containing protein n=1 Tax=Yersinia ruckeri TaxID=29486 RepID=UPI003BF54D0C
MILDLRMRHALSLIVSSRKNLYSISEEIGYNSTSYFIKNFKDYYGVTPKKLGLMLNNVNRIIL